jgi:manganese-dependent ADP-ribose/CDP-alcohol diphosphatase
MKILAAIFLALIIIFNMPEKADPKGQIPVKNREDKPPDNNHFSFGLIADVQYGDFKSAGTRYYRSSPDKLAAALASFRKDPVDFIINLGDLIERDYESYKPVLNAINSSGITTYHVTGNHDYSVEPRYLSRLPLLSGSREGYYSIVYRKFRFIFMNGNEISVYSSAGKTLIMQAEKYIAGMKKKGEINAIEWNGGIGSEQLLWISGQLDDAAASDQKVIMICHFPVAPENIHNLLNYREVLDKISKYHNIIAWFSGHNHEGNYVRLNNIHHVTFKGMVETKDKNSFAIIDVTDNKLIVKGFGREDTRELSF